MKKRKRIPRTAFRWACLLLLHTMMIIAALCAINITAYWEVSDDRGIYQMDIWDRDKEFEESIVFHEIMEDDLREVAVQAVIRKQMEGENGIYDSSKEVNISAYANRKDISYSGGVTAYYSLEDLLKWYRHGITFNTKSFTSLESLLDYLEVGYAQSSNIRQFGTGVESPFLEEQEKTSSDKIQIDLQDGNLLDSKTTASEDASSERDKQAYLQSQYALLNYTLDMYGINHYELLSGESGETIYVVSMLNCNYLSKDGRKLEDIAQTWEEYGILQKNAINTISDLGYNYEIYNDIKELFNQEITNVRYCIEIEENGQLITYSNDGLQEMERDGYYHDLGVYVTYQPGSMMFDTNTALYEGTLWDIFYEHEYTLNEDASIWFGVDTKYPVQDIYQQAAVTHTHLKDVWTYIGVAVSAVVVWVFLLTFLSVTTGRTYDEDEKVVVRLHWFDYVPMEVALLLASGIYIAEGLYIIGLVDSFSMHDRVLFEKMEEALHIGGVAAFFASLTFTLFWFSLIRRLKKHTLIKNSICYMICSSIHNLVKRVTLKIKGLLFVSYDKKGTVSRTLQPLVFYVLLNVFLGLLLGFTWGRYRYNSVYVLLVMVMSSIPVSLDVLGVYVLVRNNLKRMQIVDGIDRIREGEMDYKVDTRSLHGENLKLAIAVNNIGEGIKHAVEASMRDERMKADLITNVSHDIKTPLTSIINYVDLLKRERIETEPVKGYIEVLDVKSQRLKQLTDDLVEVSRISSGNLVLNLERINLIELMKQAVGEFSEKLEEKNISVVQNYAEDLFVIQADSRHMWRVIENLFHNICKYTLSGTRVFVDIQKMEYDEHKKIVLTIKNISAQPLKVRPEELMERFIRGEESRTTEGSGLGLSIASSLTEVQGGKFNIVLDGDLFKVILFFPWQEPQDGDQSLASEE